MGAGQTCHLTTTLPQNSSMWPSNDLINKGHKDCQWNKWENMPPQNGSRVRGAVHFFGIFSERNLITVSGFYMFWQFSSCSLYGDAQSPTSCRLRRRRAITLSDCLYMTPGKGWVFSTYYMGGHIRILGVSNFPWRAKGADLVHRCTERGHVSTRSRFA